MSQHTSHYFCTKSASCSLCKCGPKTKKAERACDMNKWKVDIVIFDDEHAFNHTDGREITTYVFGLSGDLAEARAMERYVAKNPDERPYQRWAFAMKVVPRKEWFPQWKAKQKT